MDSQDLSFESLFEFEQRAHELRAQAARDMAVAVGRWFRQKMHLRGYATT